MVGADFNDIRPYFGLLRRYRVEGLGFKRVWGLRVWGSKVWEILVFGGLGFRVEGFRVRGFGV